VISVGCWKKNQQPPSTNQQQNYFFKNNSKFYHGNQKWNMSNKLIDYIENRENYPEKATKIYESCVRYIFNIRDDIEVEEIDIKRGDLIMTRGRQLYEDGIKKGKLEGMKLGEYLKAKETVKKLLSKKLDKKTISEVTELSIEQIKKIEEEMNQNKN
jgi:predicted transposase/invertase (TIGR01784 family)